MSLNREARLIVESLRMPGRLPEQHVEVISVCRADGREVSLAESAAEAGGFPLAMRTITAGPARWRHGAPCRPHRPRGRGSAVLARLRVSGQPETVARAWSSAEPEGRVLQQ